MSIAAAASTAAGPNGKAAWVVAWLIACAIDVLTGEPSASICDFAEPIALTTAPALVADWFAQVTLSSHQVDTSLAHCVAASPPSLDQEFCIRATASSSDALNWSNRLAPCE